MEGQPPDCIVFSIPKARKAHKCCECKRTIPPGEHYHLVTGVWDGTPDRFKTCQQCEALSARFRKLIEYEYNPPFGMLAECICEERMSEEDLLSLMCKACDGSGSVDSGGQNPDGSWINVPCPECRPCRKP